MISERTSEGEDFARFKVRNKDTFQEMVSMLEKLDPFMPRMKSGRCGRVDRCRQKGL